MKNKTTPVILISFLVYIAILYAGSRFSIFSGDAPKSGAAGTTDGSISVEETTSEGEVAVDEAGSGVSVGDTASNGGSVGDTASSGGVAVVEAVSSGIISGNAPDSGQPGKSSSQKDPGVLYVVYLDSILQNQGY